MSSSGGVGGAGGGGGGVGGAGGPGGGSGGPGGTSGSAGGTSGGPGGTSGSAGGPSGASGKDGSTAGSSATGGTTGTGNTAGASETGSTANANGVSASDMGDVSAAADGVSESQVSAQADSVTGSAVDGFDRAEAASPKGGPGVGPSEGAMAEADRRSDEAAEARADSASLDAKAADARAETSTRAVSEGTQAEISRREENAKVEAVADRLAATSPTAAGLLSSFRASSGVFERSAKGGWFSNADRPTIGVPAGTELENMRTIAHELGHFGFVGNPQGAYAAPGRPAGVTDRQIEHQRQADYVVANANARLADEGNAALTNKAIRDEVMARTGLDIGVSGFANPGSMPLGVGTVDQQRQAIGDFFGTNLTTSTTGQNYRSYYGQSYIDHYARNHLPGKE